MLGMRRSCGTRSLLCARTQLSGTFHCSASCRASISSTLFSAIQDTFGTPARFVLLFSTTSRRTTVPVTATLVVWAGPTDDLLPALPLPLTVEPNRDDRPLGVCCEWRPSTQAWAEPFDMHLPQLCLSTPFRACFP